MAAVTKKAKLRMTAGAASKWKSDGMAVLVYNMDTKKNEIIYIRADSILEKMKYYENAYNDDLELKNNHRIKIISGTIATNHDSIGYIEKALLEKLY